MANVVLTTVGTDGDVIPFINIGRALRTHGHKITLVTHCYYKEQCKQAELNFLSLDTYEEYERFIEEGSLLNSLAGIPIFFRRHILSKVISGYEMIKKLHYTEDAIIITRAIPGIAARLAAERLKIPLMLVYTAPGHLTTMPLTVESMSPIFGADINSIRKTIDLSPIVDWSYWWRYADKSVGLWPKWFSDPEPASDVVLTGFMWHENPPIRGISKEVQDILDSGVPPILITGGTGMLADKQFFSVSVEACRLLNHHGILVTQYSELVPNHLPENVKWFKYVPSLEGMMPYMRAIVHHGGMGTLSQSLAAGIPQLVWQWVLTDLTTLLVLND